MRVLYFCFPVLLSLMLYSCAIRDNEYDPLSPLHKSPVLSVVMDFDSTRANTTQSDTLSAVAPFHVSFGAEASDFFLSDKKATITFRYYFNNDLQKELIDFTNDSLVLRSAGEHKLVFSSSAENGATTDREIIINVTSPNKPSIVSFTASYDSLPLHAAIPVSFFVDFTDKGRVADSIVYAISPVNQPVHILSCCQTTPETVRHDTLTLESLYSDQENTVTFTAFLYDELGGVDSQSTTITFSKDVQIIRGTPAVIDSIFIVETTPVIYEDRLIPFTFSASDENLKRLKDFLWDFGDNGYAKAKYPYHAFETPGIYTVTLSVTDDSLNVISKSMTITVKKKERFDPEFSSFSVENDSGPAPLTISLTAVPVDKDGWIAYMGIVLNTVPLDPVWPPVQNHKITIKNPGIYYLTVFAVDNDGYRCNAVQKITVTEPQQE